MLQSDLDWFVFDASGSLIHFTSAGGFVPSFVREEVVEVEKLISALPELSTHIITRPDLRQVAELNSEESFGLFIGSYAEYARRGMFTYDKTSPYCSGSTYYLVASPVVSLKYEDFPLEIRSKIPVMSNLLVVASQAPLEITAEDLVEVV